MPRRGQRRDRHLGGGVKGRRRGDQSAWPRLAFMSQSEPIPTSHPPSQGPRGLPGAGACPRGQAWALSQPHSF